MTVPGRMRNLLLVGAALALLVFVAGCGSGSETGSSGGGGGSSSSSGPSGELVIGMGSDTSTLNPAECVPQPICFPAYDGLIYMTAEGEFKPDLATSWKFTDAKHQTLQLELRKGVHFTDGSELDAEAVAESIKKFPTVPGPNAQANFPIKSVKPVSKYTVDINYSIPVTYAYALFQITAQNGVGSIVGPEGLANSKSLEASSDGIGPYKLDPSQTTKGAAYTYVPNKDYFNQEAIKYEKVVIKPVVNPSARLSALQSGQIGWAQDMSAREVETATSSGLQLSENELGSMESLVLMNRKSGPLANQKVRQAIAYAVPREEITGTVFGPYATATGSLVPTGTEGYNASNTDMYTYDPEKAKQLLAQAGYSDGFELSVLDVGFFDPGYTLGQALTSSLEEVGIKVKLTTSNALPGAITQMVYTGKYDAQISGVSGLGPFSLANVQFEPGSGFNPLKAPNDPKLKQMVSEAALEPTEAAQETKMEEATTRIDELVYAVPIASVPTLQLTQSNLENVPEKFKLRELDPFSPVTSENWSG